MNANAHLTTNPHHRDPDHTIDRALSALRDAAPRPGLEGRILASLEHRAATPQSTRFHISARIALWAATSAAIIAIASVFLLHHHAAPTDLARTPQTSPGLAAGFSPLNTGTNSRGALAPARPSTNAATLSEAPQGRSRRTPVFQSCSDHLHQACPVHEDNDVTNTPTDAQALADLHAPSHPAPPLPLTPQEKLFLRTLRYGNATQLAELSPIVRAKKDADETTDFKAFFPDPPPLHQPGDPE